MEEFLITLLAVNYAAYTLYFFYQYLRPGKNTINMVENAIESFAVFAMFFVLLWVIWVGLISQLLTYIVAGGVLLVMGYYFLKSWKKSDIARFLLTFSFVQETYLALTYSPPGYYLFLFAWYYLGVFVILISAKLLGFVLRAVFPKIERGHEKSMESAFGPEWRSQVTLASGVGYGAGRGFQVSPSEIVSIGICYGIWMIFRLLIEMGVITFAIRIG